MRQLFISPRPELDNFLYAAVGEEIDGMPLSVISALTRLDLDPREEAGRLASLAKRDAIEQLALLIARLPAARWPAVEAGRIADRLIELLPRHDKARGATPVRLPPGPGAGDQIKLWLIGVILGTAVLVSVIAHGGLSFGGQQPSEPVARAETPARAN